MTDTTAKIRAKGLAATGFTETLATKYADQELGQRFLAVVELKTEFVGEDAEGNRRLELIITQVEPAQNKDMTEHLRRLSRSAFYERKLHDADQPLPIDNKDDLEPKVKDVLAAGQHLEHKEDQAEEEPPHDPPTEPGDPDVPDPEQNEADHEDYADADQNDADAWETANYDENAADLQAAIETEQDLIADPDPTDEPARHLTTVPDPFTPQAG